MDRIPSVLSFLYKSILEIRKSLSMNTSGSEQSQEQPPHEVIQSLRNDKQQLEETLNELRIQLSDHASTMQQLTLENQSLNESILQLTSERDEERTRVMMLEQQAELLNQKTKATEQGLRTTFAELKIVKGEYEELEDMYEQKCKELEEAMKTVKSQSIDLCVLEKQLEYLRHANEMSAGSSTASRLMSPMSVGSYAFSSTMGENAPMSPISSTCSDMSDSPARFNSPLSTRGSPLTDITNSLPRDGVRRFSSGKSKLRLMNHAIHELSRDDSLTV